MRWEMEARGEFTIEGCIEMAWIMGFIKHFGSQLKDGSLYVGWVDSKTNEPVDDKEVTTFHISKICIITYPHSNPKGSQKLKE